MLDFKKEQRRLLMGIKRSYDKNKEVLEDLHKAVIGDEEHFVLDGNEDGRFIASRIAFEAYSKEERERIERMRAKSKERAERLKKEQARRRNELELFQIAYKMRKLQEK